MRISTLQSTTTSRSIPRSDDDDDRPLRLRSYTLPSSPTYSRSASSSSSDFEFSIISSSSAAAVAAAETERSSVSGADITITPADDLFYKGKILPLQLTPRISMVKSLFFDSSSTVSSASANSRHSTCSSSSSDAAMFRDDVCESRRASFFADLTEDDDDFIISEPMSAGQSGQSGSQFQSSSNQLLPKKNKSFSFGKKLSSVFKKEPPRKTSESITTSVAVAASEPLNQTSAARDVMRKYLKKAKPFYEKMARRQKVFSKRQSAARDDSVEVGMLSDKFFSRNPMMNSKNGQGVLAMSCPASIRSSPCHSGMRDSSCEELQSAIQGAIAYCKNSMLQS